MRGEKRETHYPCREPIQGSPGRSLLTRCPSLQTKISRRKRILGLRRAVILRLQGMLLARGVQRLPRS